MNAKIKLIQTSPNVSSENLKIEKGFIILSFSAPAWGAWCGRAEPWRSWRRRRRWLRRRRGRRLGERRPRRWAGAWGAETPSARNRGEISFLPLKRTRIYSGCHRRRRWRWQWSGGGVWDERRRIWGVGFCAMRRMLSPLWWTFETPPRR